MNKLATLLGLILLGSVGTGFAMEKKWQEIAALPGSIDTLNRAVKDLEHRVSLKGTKMYIYHEDKNVVRIISELLNTYYANFIAAPTEITESVVLKDSYSYLVAAEKGIKALMKATEERMVYTEDFKK